MNPRQMHIGCDFFLLLPILGIILSVLCYRNNFEKDSHILKSLFSSWRNKPIHLVQDSYHKSCNQIGMDDLIIYTWPGNLDGCSCLNANNEQVIVRGKCTQEQIYAKCETIPSINPFNIKKWKGHYLCTSSIKSKSYFELSRIKPDDNCSYKYKKCGVIDTLGYILCIPENENCPLNSISFKSNIEAQNVRIDTSNTDLNGKIYTNFRVSEEKPCVNPTEYEFAESSYPLMRKELSYGCSTYITSDDGKSYNYNINYDVFDGYSKRLFYEQNNIMEVFAGLPNYPYDKIESKMVLYGGVYTGWKKICEKKELLNYMNSNPDDELNQIINSSYEYNLLLHVYSLALGALFLLGVVLLKYKMIIVGPYRIEITYPSLLVIIITYSSIIVVSGILFYIAEVNLDVIKNAKLSNDFFELINNNDCSDSFTNGILKYLTREFHSYANRYFNIKILSITAILFSISMLLYTIFNKSSFEITRKNKKKITFKFD